MQPPRVRMRSCISGADSQGGGSSPASAPPRMGMASSSPIYPCMSSSATTTSTEAPSQRIRLNHRSDRLILLKVHCLVQLALTGGYILSLPENSEL